MERVSTLAKAEELAERVARGESCEVQSARRTGKSTLARLLSDELRKRGIAHQIVVHDARAVASYAENGWTTGVVAQRERLEGARALIVDEPWVMAAEYIETLEASAPVLVKIGTPIGP